MAIQDKDTCCSMTANQKMGCCKVESVVSIDERGQMVLPKETREKAGIRAGDKLAVITWEKDGIVCCISLMKVESLANVVKSVLEPVIQEIMK